MTNRPGRTPCRIPRVPCPARSPGKIQRAATTTSSSATETRERVRCPSERVSGGRFPPGEELKATAAPRGQPRREPGEVAAGYQPHREPGEVAAGYRPHRERRAVI